MQVHPSQISPAESFDIFYFLRNHTDGTTYYVRGVVYDVRTGEVLQTVNLDQAATNSRLFIKTVQAPPDPVGMGRNIVAIATVYTDSGYNTKSPDYEEQEQYFLIKVGPVAHGGGGGLGDLRPLQEWLSDIIDRKLAALPKPSEFPEQPFDALFGAIGKLQETLNRVPKDAYDHAPVLEAVAAVQSAVDGIPAPDPVDLMPVLASIRSVLSEIQALRKDNGNAAAAMLSAHQKGMQDMGAQLLADVEKGLRDLMDRQELTIPLTSLINERPKETTATPEQDLSHLM